MALPYLMIAAGALQFMGGQTKAFAIQGQAQIQNQINQMNAKYMEMDAWEAEKFGYTQASRYQSLIDKTLGEQTTAFAANNVDVNYGTARAVQEETRLAGFFNALDFKEAARRKAKGLRMQASSLRLGSQLQMSQSRVDAELTEKSALIGGITTGVSGFGRGG